MRIPRPALALIGLFVLVAVAWLAWAWLSGGFCSPPPGSACL